MGSRGRSRRRGSGAWWRRRGRSSARRRIRIKTDQRDAERVLRLLMIDALHAVRVPTVEEEALRDLVRAREDLRGDLMRARQRLSKLLLRHGIVYEDTSSTWTQRHRAWLRAQDLGGGAQATLLDYLGAIDTLELPPRPAGGNDRQRSSRARRTRRPSPGCGACAGSTRSPPSAWPPRSATSAGSIGPGS